jgi:hypothetical protein
MQPTQMHARVEVCLCVRMEVHNFRIRTSLVYTTRDSYLDHQISCFEFLHHMIGR